MRSGKARIVLLAVLGVLIVAIVAARVGYGVWARRCQAEFDAAIAEIRARGEPVWFSELKPKDHPEWDEAAAGSNPEPLRAAQRPGLQNPQ